MLSCRVSAARRAGRKDGKEGKRNDRSTNRRTRGISPRTIVCLLPATRGIDPVCRAALVFGAQTFAKTCPACSWRPIIVDSKDIIRKRDRQGQRDEGGGDGTKEGRKGRPAVPGDLVQRKGGRKGAQRAGGGGPWPSNEVKIARNFFPVGYLI